MLTHVHVENYKSLENLSLNLRPFMVFAGPNNSGKSNILDLFQFLKNFARFGAQEFYPRGGYEQVVWAGQWRRNIVLQLTGDVAIPQEKCYPFKYDLEISLAPVPISVTREIFTVMADSHGRKLLQYPDEENQASVFDLAGQKKGGLRLAAGRSYLLEFGETEFYPCLGHFVQEVLSWSFYNLVPWQMRIPLPPRPELGLESGGQNLSTVVNALITGHPEVGREIKKLLQAGIKEVEEILSLLLEDGRTQVAIKELGLSVPIYAPGISDGTLRLLALLAILYSPKPASLICIEEPENCVHPRLLEFIVDLLREASQNSQILITTHSPYLLDHLLPEEVFVVEKEEAKTRVKRVEDEKGIKEAVKSLTLGEMYYAGSLGGTP